MERVGIMRSARPALAAVLARLGQPAEAWRSLEEDLGRGLLDELAARQDWKLTPEERDRLREVTAALERLDRLVETAPRTSTRPSAPGDLRSCAASASWPASPWASSRTN